MFVDESDAFYAASALLEKTRTTEWYFRKTRTSEIVFVNGCIEILREKLPDIARHLDNLKVDLVPVVTAWVNRLFIGHVSFQNTMRFVDAFLNEGSKIFVR